jgi:hypothetical protein
LGIGEEEEGDSFTAKGVVYAGAFPDGERKNGRGLACAGALAQARTALAGALPCNRPVGHFIGWGGTPPPTFDSRGAAGETIAP